MDKVISRRISRKSQIAILIVSVTGFMFIVNSSFSSESIGRTLKKEQMTTSTVKKKEFQEYIPVRATVESANSIFIGAVESGRIEKIFVQEGEFVEKGQPILTLSNARLQLDVIAMEAQATEQLNNLQNTQLALEKSTLDLKAEIIESDSQINSLKRQIKSLSALYNANAIPKDQYERIDEQIRYWQNRNNLSEEKIEHNKLVRLTRETQLKSSIRLLEDNLKMARSVLDGLEVKAPQSGKLTSLTAELGESKSQGENLGIIDDVENFKATALVSEFYLNKVREGQIAEIIINNKKYQMEIEKVFLEVLNSQFRVEFIFKEDVPENLKRGQTLNANLLISESESVLAVSNGAFFNDTGGAWVFVYDERSNKAEKRDVRFGRRTPAELEVLDGLNDGDQIITSSYKSFLDADEIEVTR